MLEIVRSATLGPRLSRPWHELPLIGEEVDWRVLWPLLPQNDIKQRRGRSGTGQPSMDGSDLRSGAKPEQPEWSFNKTSKTWPCHYPQGPAAAGRVSQDICHEPRLSSWKEASSSHTILFHCLLLQNWAGKVNVREHEPATPWSFLLCSEIMIYTTEYHQFVLFFRNYIIHLFECRVQKTIIEVDIQQN